MRELAIRFFYDYAVLVVAVALAGIAIVYACHVRLRKLRLRERLSHEVEDALVQNTQGLILNVHGIVKELPADDPTRQRMENALDRADQQLSTDRDRVQDLRTQAMLDDIEGPAQSIVPTSVESPASSVAESSKRLAKLQARLRRFSTWLTFKRPR